MSKPAIASEWLLDPEVRFLNHGSFGACPRRVLELQSELRDRLEREPVRFFLKEYPRLAAEARADLGAWLGASENDIAFVPNATTAVNSVLRSLPLEAGDELVVTDHEYNACRNVLDYVAAERGARVRVAQIPFPIGDPSEVVDAVASNITTRTRLLLVDHVTSPTALVMPIAALVSLCREHDVEVLIDGAHAPAMIDLDLRAIDADYYTGNLHKWACAPKGAAFLWVRPERQPTTRPAVISHGANMPTKHASRFRLEFDWTGTDDPTPSLCVPMAVRFLAAIRPGGLPALMRANRELALKGREIICERLAVEPPAPRSMIGSMAAIPLPVGQTDPDATHFDIDPLQEDLFASERIEVPIFPWPANGRTLRISAQAYNCLEDYEALAEALAARLS